MWSCCNRSDRKRRASDRTDVAEWPQNQTPLVSMITARVREKQGSRLSDPHTLWFTDRKVTHVIIRIALSSPGHRGPVVAGLTAPEGLAAVLAGVAGLEASPRAWGGMPGRVAAGRGAGAHGAPPIAVRGDLAAHQALQCGLERDSHGARGCEHSRE